ncbi:MAG: hypothetical protein Q9204_005378, partial [Flavoplaca sp. TL-2023a]
MSGGYDYVLTDFSAPAENQTISSTSGISKESFDETTRQNPFIDQTETLENTQPSQPYDPASGNHLLSSEFHQYKAYREGFFREWAVEWTAWLVSAISLVALVTLFAVYRNEPLRQWKADITPATAVAILSQVGQTSILAPVVACICQSMWLWLDKESKATQQVNSNRGQASLTMMQKYDEGSRGPLNSLFLLWKRPDALLVWLGTINTLLIIIFGSFAQQSLQLPTREYNVTNVTDKGDNFIRRALQYRAPRPAVDQHINKNHTARGTVLETFELGQTLWVGASNPTPPVGSAVPSHMPEGLDTLEQFYVIYVRDLTRWDELDKTENHKDELVALRATLSLCVNTYHTDMKFGVMNTQLLSQEKNLDWQIDTESNGTPSSSTVTHGGDRFWMSGENRKSFHDYLSIQTFTGSAKMRSGSPDSGGNFTENEIVRRIAMSLYEDPAGIPGLSGLLDNLAMSMSNA